jgi:outer membrane protein assembly factor BamD (BamD/ComL family)
VPEAAAPAATRVASPPHAARTEIRERDRTLAAERGLIEQARTALGREQAATALAALERHARDFPQGALEEERESLLVQALVGAERFDQARKTATRFHKRFPRSIFGAVVDEALNSIP